MNVLITGGAGFIGSNLADRLISEGHKVVIIDDLSTGRQENVNEKATFVKGSIVDVNACRAAFELARTDVIVHAAASYKDPDGWMKDANVNTLGTINVIKTAKEFGFVRRLIYFQTSLCYGREPKESPITLDHPINPNNSYAITKVAGERFIELSGLDFVSFRLANCYGPRNLSGPIPTFYQKLTKGEKCFVSDSRRDFVYIDDLLDIVMAAISGTGQGYYHVATGSDYAIQEVFDIIRAQLEVEELITPVPSEYIGRFWDDVKTILLDPSRTTHDFGIVPSTQLASGLEKALEWYKEHGVTETYTHLKQKEPDKN